MKRRLSRELVGGIDLLVALALALLALLELWWPDGFVGTGPVEGQRAVLVPAAPESHAIPAALPAFATARCPWFLAERLSFRVEAVGIDRELLRRQLTDASERVHRG